MSVGYLLVGVEVMSIGGDDEIHGVFMIQGLK